MIFIIKLIYYCLVGNMLSLFNIWKIKRSLKLSHQLYDLPIKKSKQLVILGSSDSINQISESQWQRINNFTTVGVNYFLLHKFVPDIIQLEINRGNDHHYFENLIKILNAREADFKNSIILIKSNYSHSFSELQDKIAFLRMIPFSLKKNLRFCVDFPIPATTLKDYKTALRIFNRLDLFNQRNLYFLPHLRSSIGLSTVLGIKFDFTEIIYAGVDLNNKNTFYDKKSLFENYGIIFHKDNLEGVHQTNDPNYSEITIVEVINLLMREIGPSHQFSVLSNKSSLRKIMPNKYF
jgi:hypothetical protein